MLFFGRNHCYLFAVPSRVPSTIYFNKKSTEITVDWSPLPEQYINGRLLGYRVYFQKTAHNYLDPVASKAWRVKVTNPNTTRVTFSGLKPAQLYDIDVTAFTSKGEGPRTFRTSVKTGATLKALNSVFQTTVVKPIQKWAKIYAQSLSFYRYALDCFTKKHMHVHSYWLRYVALVLELANF